MATSIKLISRFILRNPLTIPLSSSSRWLCTAATENPTAAVTENEKNPKRRNAMFHQATKANDERRVDYILNKWVSKGTHITKIDLVNLRNYFRKRKNFSSALQLYDWMESNKIELNNSDQAVRIDLLGKTQGISSAEIYFNTLQESEKTCKTYGALLSCYTMAKLLDKALDFFEQMKALNYTSTLNYNSMLSLYYSIDQPEKVVSTFEEMEENNIPLDLYSYNLLINSYAAMKNLDAVEGVLEKMKSNNMEPDLFTYGNLAGVYISSGLREKAIGFLDIMENMKGKKKEVFEATRTRLKLYGDMNDLSGVNRAWESIKSASPKLNNTSYLLMLMALSKLGDREGLDRIYKEWEGQCKYFDYRIPNVLLEYYLSRDMIEEASLLYEKVVKEKRSEPNLRTLNLFATLCVKKCEIDLALQYLEKGLGKCGKLEKSDWFPRDETIKLFVNYFEEKNDVERGERFIESMKKVARFDSEPLVLKFKASDEGRS